MADFAGLLQFLQRAERFGHGHFGVDAVELVKVDAVELEAAQAHLDALAQIFRAANRRPFLGPGPRQAALGGDDQPARIRMQRFRDQAFADFRAVGIGGVDEIDAQFHRLAQHAAGFGRVLRFAPDPGSGDAHGAKAQPMHRQIAAKLEDAARLRIRVGFPGAVFMMCCSEARTAADANDDGTPSAV